MPVYGMPQLIDKQNIQAVLDLLSQISTIWKHPGISLNFLVPFQMLGIRKMEPVSSKGGTLCSGPHVCPVCEMSNNMHIIPTPCVCAALCCSIKNLWRKREGRIIFFSGKERGVIEAPVQRIPVYDPGENDLLKSPVYLPQYHCDQSDFTAQGLSSSRE